MKTIKIIFNYSKVESNTEFVFIKTRMKKFVGGILYGELRIRN